MAFCTKCGAQVSDGTAFCGSCGQPLGAPAGGASAGSGPASPPPAPAAATGGLESNIAAALAYIWIVAILWLVIEPYNKDKFIRFHSFQALAFGVVWFVLNVVVGFLPFVNLFLWPLLGLAGLVIWLVCLYKAFNKEWFKIPVIGDWAMQQAG